MGKNMTSVGRRGAAITLGLSILAVTGLGATSLGAQGGGHVPVTICHKPGTAAEHEITVDNESVIDAHIGHGDTLGSCTPVVTTPPTTPAAPIAKPGAAAAAPAAAAPATPVLASPRLTG